MGYFEALTKGTNAVIRNFWLLLIPVLSDTVLLLLNYINFGIFIDSSRIPQLQIKLSTPSALPSLKNIVDAFPGFTSFNTSSGWQNSILSASNIPEPWDTIYLLCGVILFMIVSAFLQGGFLGCIFKTLAKNENSSLKDFFHYGNYYCGRFLGLNIIASLLMVPMLFFIPFLFVFMILSIPFFYLSYSLVWDDLSIIEAIVESVSFFTSKLGNSLGFVLFIALQFAVLSVILTPITNMNVFLGLILYNSFASFLVAGIMAMYGGNKDVLDGLQNSENTDIQ